MEGRVYARENDVSVTVTLTEANLQPFSQSKLPTMPKGFELYRLSDDQTGDASAGSFTYQLELNAGGSLNPGYWTIVSGMLVGSVAPWVSLGARLILDGNERFEKWERWTADYAIWQGAYSEFSNFSSVLPRDAHQLDHLFLGRPLLPPVQGTASAGQIQFAAQNINSCRYGLQFVLARSMDGRPFPSWIHL